MANLSQIWFFQDNVRNIWNDLYLEIDMEYH